jgi:cytochrome d ubiquinol oxidase subunit I
MADMFEGWNAEVLARAQFTFTMSFHIVFPAFPIGLASYLAVLEALWLWTGREVFINLFNYWLKIFAVAFGMGVVSGIVMSYQSGTNWAGFADKAGPVIGPLMAYEVLTVAALLTVVAGGRGRNPNAVGEGPVIFADCVRRRRRGALRE